MKLKFLNNKNEKKINKKILKEQIDIIEKR